jgi:hypothetical protein
LALLLCLDIFNWRHGIAARLSAVLLGMVQFNQRLEGEEMINYYSQWFYQDGWILVTALGIGLGWSIGLKGYWVILPLVFLAILGK